jgi:hypothetical protein
MKTDQFILLVLFIFGVSASAVFAFPQFPESPVHEQRKALFEKNKIVYGPKTTVNSETAAADQGTGDDKDKAKEKDKNKENTKGVKKGAAKSTIRSRNNQNAIPPPSKNLLKLKQAHEKATKKKPVVPQAPVQPDFSGTVSPPVQQ